MKTPIERFAEKYEYLPDTCCWLWTAVTVRGGYGQLRVDGKGVYAHRFAYEFYRGPLPKFEHGGLQLDHLCRNRNCCNPWHLELVTGSENIRRGARTKLTDAQVLEVRARYAAGGVSQRALAREYGVTQPNIHAIVNRETWTHL